MASAQEAGTIHFYRQTANGARIPLFSADMAAIGPSGAADGVIQSTPDMWTYIPLQNAANKVLRANEKLVVTFTPRGTDTLDASDCRFVIPITYQDGTADSLGDPTSTVDWDVLQASDILYNAGIEADVCIKKVLQPFALGSNLQKAFMSLEDDTA